MKSTLAFGLAFALVALVGLAAVPSASAAPPSPPGLCDIVNNVYCHVPGAIVGDAVEFVESHGPDDLVCACGPIPIAGP